MAFILDSACGCSAGRQRSNNEDNFYFYGRSLPQLNTGLESALSMRRSLGGAECFAVFDGMGGELSGEAAAYTAASALKSALPVIDWTGAAEERLSELCQTLNDAVCAQAQKLMTTHMGCTVAMLLFLDGQVYSCNLGDSKTFRYGGGVLTKLSEDHDDSALLALVGAKNRKPRLTQHLGISRDELLLMPSVRRGELSDGDTYLICSDGLTDMLTPDEISSVLGKGTDAGACANALIAGALEHGGKDNVTAIVIRADKA